MAEPNVMVKDATPKKVMALASRKYSRDDRIKKDEEELEKLLAEQKGETTEEQKAEEVKGRLKLLPELQQSIKTNNSEELGV